MSSKREAVGFLRQHKLGLVALSLFAALLFGFIGYLEDGKSILDAAYDSLSLLVFSYEAPEGDASPLLQVARFAVPAAAAFATLAALAALLEDQLHLIRGRRCRDHVVVCGLGRRGACLVRSLRTAERPAAVVAVESDRGNPNVEIARRLGAIVTIGDATEAEVLAAAGTGRAATLVSLLPADADNAAVASLARELCTGGSGLTALCHVSDGNLAADLTSAAIGEQGEGELALEWFSVPERAAGLMLSEHVELAPRPPGAEPPHLGVVGDGGLARAVVLNAAQQWHAVAGEDAGLLRITVAAEGAAKWIERLCDRHPSLARAAKLSAYEDDLRSRAHRAAARAALDDAGAVFVCAGEDSEGLELGFAVSRVLTHGQPVVVGLQARSAFERLKPLDGKEGGGSIRLFNVVERTCSARMIADGLTETLARTLHDVYRRQSAGKSGDEEPRPLVPWEELPDQFKESSRAQARHLAKKLQESGCAIRPLTDWDTPPMRFSEKEIEHLAQLEHERWNEERKAKGGAPGPHTDRRRKVNRWIDVPWEELPGEIADYDREFVRALPLALAAAGYDVYRAK